MTRTNILISIAFATLTISVLALLNQPESEPAWPSKIQGFSFSPLRADHDATQEIYPAVDEIDQDLALLAGKTNAVRTYTVESSLAQIPGLAARHHINVALGAWIDDKLDNNETELLAAIDLAQRHRNVVRVFVGNEVMLRGDISSAQLYDYLDRARAALDMPVSTAEPWHVWIKHPELAEHVDFIAVHMLPYWEGVQAELAVDYVIARYDEVKAMFPDKPIVIAEVGWPSNGRTRQKAVASESNQAIFLRQFLAHAEANKYVYYVMEAFDQPWKRVTEGSVGAYWGVYDVERQAKFPFDAPVVREPRWWMLGMMSVLLASTTLIFLFADSRTLTTRGRSFLAIVAYFSATAIVWIIYDYSQQYFTISAIVVGVLLLLGMIGVLLVLLAEAHEWAEAHWVSAHRRKFLPMRVTDAELPMVSIHLPAYNEPPDMVIETLNALAGLDYPRFEVLVIDNNTKDPAVWNPVATHCAALGLKFRFFHVDSLEGFKAGALNYALLHTAPEAEIIAVIDSDYVVAPGWLRDLVPQFRDSKVGIVQAPQDYRDGAESMFKAMCYAEYKGFFFIGMITRNERNAIIQHGTMTMIRRSALADVGGWGEWTITEDAELGLRIFVHGYEAHYIARSYGKGLMPDSFADFKKQRFRWAYGAIQILRHHAGVLLGGKPSRLTRGQRYHFIAGWLPWLADGMNLLFSLGALVWCLMMIVAPQHVDPPLLVFSLLPLALFAFKLSKMIYLYRSRVQATLRQTIAAALAGLALSHTISLAILSGFFTRNKPFYRTPKRARAQRLLKALTDSREETLLMLALWVAAWGVSATQPYPSLDVFIWIMMLLVQSIPYLASLLVSLASAFPDLPASLVDHEDIQANVDRVDSGMSPMRHVDSGDDAGQEAAKK